jgi:hypothetical protein
MRTRTVNVAKPSLRILTPVAMDICRLRTSRPAFAAMCHPGGVGDILLGDDFSS